MMIAGLGLVFMIALMIFLFLGIFGAVVLIVMHLTKAEQRNQIRISEDAQKIDILHASGKISEEEAENLKKSIGYTFVPEEKFAADKHIKLTGVIHLIVAISLLLPVSILFAFLVVLLPMKSSAIRADLDAQVEQERGALRKKFAEHLEALSEKNRKILKQIGKEREMINRKTKNLEEKKESLLKNKKENKDGALDKLSGQIEDLQAEVRKIDEQKEDRLKKFDAEMAEAKARQKDEVMKIEAVDRHMKQRRQEQTEFSNMTQAVSCTIFLILFAIVFIYIISAFRLMKRSNLARNAIIIYSVVLLFCFPIGTALGIYSIWVLIMREHAADYFA